jgi:hypothetical protein
MQKIMVYFILASVFIFSSVSFAQEQKGVKIENGIISFPDQVLQGITVSLSELKLNYPPDTPKEILAIKGKIFKDEHQSNYVIPMGYDSNKKEIGLRCIWESRMDGKPGKTEMHGLSNPEVTILRPLVGSSEFKLNFLKDGKLRLTQSNGHVMNYTPVAEFPVSGLPTKSNLASEFVGKILAFEKWGSKGGARIEVVDSKYVAVVNYQNEKLTWSMDDDGKFCIGMENKGKTGFWGCKTIKKLPDGSFYSEGATPDTPSKLFVFSK